MAELSYLDIHPSRRIVDQIEADDPDYKSSMVLLVEVGAYVEIMEMENVQFLEMRSRDSISSGDTYRFLRSQERTRNSKSILQYLATFLKHLPLEEEIADNPINPFHQLKAFVLFNIDLLKEKDVESAILKEHERLGLLNELNSWYYRGQLDKSHKSLTIAVNNALRATLPGYMTLFQGIEQLCTFWFSVRNQEIGRVRKSDVLMYKLTRYLLRKYAPAL